MSNYDWGQFQIHALHIVPTMGPISQLWLYMVGKLTLEKQIIQLRLVMPLGMDSVCVSIIWVNKIELA